MKELPKITCNKCNYVQAYRGQANCIHCQKRLNNWSIVSQLKNQRQKVPRFVLAPDSKGRPTVRSA